MKPKILLMDEAFSALDPGTRAGMQKLIREVWNETKTTVLFVTHNIAEAIHLGTRIIVLSKDGEEADGSKVALDLSVPDLDGLPQIQLDEAFAQIAARVEAATGHSRLDEEEEG